VLFFFILFELVQISAIASPVHFVRVVAVFFFLILTKCALALRGTSV